LLGVGEGIRALSVKNLAKILRRKSRLKGEQKIIINKLKKQKKLSSDEFLLVYNSIWQKGPEVKYQNPHKWIDPVE